MAEFKTYRLQTWKVGHAGNNWMEMVCSWTPDCSVD